MSSSYVERKISHRATLVLLLVDYLLVKLEDGMSDMSMILLVGDPSRLACFIHGWYTSSASANDVPVGTSRSMSLSELLAMNCIGDEKELLSGRAEATLLGLKQTLLRCASFPGTSITLVSRLESN